MAKRERKIRVPVEPILNYINSTKGDLPSFFPQESVWNEASEREDSRIVRDAYPLYLLMRKRIDNAKRNGWMDYYLADELCCDIFKTHPLSVFGWDWWSYPDDKELQDRLAGRQTERMAA